MRKAVALTTGCLLAAVATHGTVYSGTHLDGPLPISTYQGFFQHIVLAIWRLWNQAHGWEAGLGHADDFGRLLAPAVFFVCPVLGFLAFSFVSRTSIGWHWWRPLAIAIAFATPLQQAIRHPFLLLGLNEPLAEAARAAVVFVLMLWSIGAIRMPRSWRPDAVRQPAAA